MNNKRYYISDRGEFYTETGCIPMNVWNVYAGNKFNGCSEPEYEELKQVEEEEFTQRLFLVEL